MTNFFYARKPNFSPASVLAPLVAARELEIRPDGYDGPKRNYCVRETCHAFLNEHKDGYGTFLVDTKLGSYCRDGQRHKAKWR